MKTCAQCHAGFEATDADRAFYEKVSPVFGGKKYLIPEPTLCPECRQRRRCAWRSERHFHRRSCGLCKKPIVATVDEPYVSYCRACWFGDGWNALDYGRDFDFSRPFFPQFHELMLAVPKAATFSINIDNCDYTNYQNDSRNCYLTFGSGFMEDCQYCDWVYYAKNTFDSSWCNRSELDYMNVDCRDTYRCQFCQDCHKVTDSMHCFDCRNCNYCFGCVGLRNKDYHLFNKPVSRQQYQEFLHQLKDPKNLPHILQEVRALRTAAPRLASRMISAENCVGDDIDNSKNCFDAYTIQDCQDCRFIYEALRCKDTYDVNRVGIDELVYEAVGGGYCQGVQFCSVGAYVNFGQYFFECFYSNHVFGSVGLNHSDYVILNKRYSPEDYQALVPKIIEHMRRTGEWGEFFPALPCPFTYNESIAQDFFPLTEAEIVALGYRFHPKDQQEYRPATAPFYATIRDVPDSITGEIMACSVTGRNFRITPQELQFYRQQDLPLPAKHPNQRYLERLALRNPRKVWSRACAKCSVPIQTPYAPASGGPEKIYCEACYLKEVY